MKAEIPRTTLMTPSMKRVAQPVLILASVAALVIVLGTTMHNVPPVHASSGCTAATLNGRYAMIQPAGFTAPGAQTNGSEVPWQFAGVVSFTATSGSDGTLHATWTAAVEGEVFGADLKNPQKSDGTYNVNADCTGSLTLAGPDAAGTTANFAIAGGGAEIVGIFTNPGSTATFDAKRQ